MQAEIASSILSRIADEEHSVRVYDYILSGDRILQSRLLRSYGLCRRVKISI